MKKHRRLVSLILTLTVLMLSIVSCGDLGEDLPDQNGTDDQNIETEGILPILRITQRRKQKVSLP